MFMGHALMEQPNGLVMDLVVSSATGAMGVGLCWQTDWRERANVGEKRRTDDTENRRRRAGVAGNNGLQRLR